MAAFRRYDHVERFSHGDVLGIASGTVYVFPKLDGTNSSVWLGPDGTVCAGSRNRQLTVEQDNGGFCAWVQEQGALRELLGCRPSWIVYGEWMVPHTLRTYREEVWRRFWVFDVFDVKKGCYVAYPGYEPDLCELGIDYIEPLCTINFPSESQLRRMVESNTYLIRDGEGVGEGVVVKNYDWTNRHGRQPWCKIVRNEFKEESRRAFGTTHKDGEFQVEVAIAEEFCTRHLVDKTRAKIILSLANESTVVLDAESMHIIEEQNRHKVIPQLLGRVFHDLVVEEVWAFLKKHKMPAVDFKMLQRHVIAKVKEHAKDLF